MSARTRFAANLRRALAAGPARVVCSEPGGEPEVMEGEATEGAVLAAVGAGKVKVRVVMANGDRVELDARHGGAKRVSAAESADRALAGKQRAIRTDESADLLRVLGIANADGSISAGNSKKYKQLAHLAALLEPAWSPLRREREPLRILDLACGNAWLSFVLGDALRRAGVPFTLLGIDRREDLVARCRQRASALRCDTMTFEVASIAGADLRSLGGPPDLVLALHACDTATDEVLALADASEARALFAVPCCQADLAAQLRRARGGPTPAYRHGLLLREHAATLTDALRVDWLEARGWDVDVVEFIDAGHTPKNRLLRGLRSRTASIEALAAWSGRLDAMMVRMPALGARYPGATPDDVPQ